MNFLVSHTFEIRFHDVIGQSTVHYVLQRKTSKTWLTYMAKGVCFGPLLFYLIHWIHLYDKTNLTFDNCCEQNLLNSSRKTLLSSPKARLITFFKTRLIKFSSQQLTHDRSYIYPLKQILYIYPLRLSL